MNRVWLMLILWGVDALCYSQGVDSSACLLSIIEKDSSIDRIFKESGDSYGFFTIQITASCYSKLLTEVHEHYHGMNSLSSAFLQGDGPRRSYYLGEEEGKVRVYIYTVPHSSEFNKSIPDAFRIHSDRFSVYVDEVEAMNLDSEISGIYGLFEEFVAYYFTVRTFRVILEHMETLKTPTLDILEFISDNTNLENSYYEFSFLIDNYLDNLKSDNRDLFASVWTLELQRAYEYIGSSFLAELKALDRLKKGIVSDIPSDYSVVDSSTLLHIKSGRLYYLWDHDQYYLTNFLDELQKR